MDQACAIGMATYNYYFLETKDDEILVNLLLSIFYESFNLLNFIIIVGDGQNFELGWYTSFVDLYCLGLKKCLCTAEEAGFVLFAMRQSFI